MKHGVLAGLIIGGVVGVYYGINMSKRDEKRLRHAADDLLGRGGDMVDGLKDRAVRLFDNWD